MKNLIFSVSLLLFFCNPPTILAQSPAEAPSPDSDGPPSIYKILKKSGQFTILIRLLKSTQVGSQMNSQLSSPNSQLTFFAPTDNAFSTLKTGTLNSLSDQQKVELLQYHMIPDFVSISNFQTLSNPVRTQASDTYEYPLNITTSGSSVNISTGLVNTSISGTVYTDDQLVIYQVDKVLKPLGIFNPRPLPPAPAPAPVKHKKNTAAKSPVASIDASGGGVSLMIQTGGSLFSIGVLMFGALFL